MLAPSQEIQAAPHEAAPDFPEFEVHGAFPVRGALVVVAVVAVAAVFWAALIWAVAALVG